jgi:hypothetical protein
MQGGANQERDVRLCGVYQVGIAHKKLYVKNMDLLLNKVPFPTAQVWKTKIFVGL